MERNHDKGLPCRVCIHTSVRRNSHHPLVESTWWEMNFLVFIGRKHRQVGSWRYLAGGDRSHGYTHTHIYIHISICNSLVYKRHAKDRETHSHSHSHPHTERESIFVDCLLFIACRLDPVGVRCWPKMK
jgi:hypothetical protein